MHTSHWLWFHLALTCISGNSITSRQISMHPKGCIEIWSHWPNFRVWPVHVKTFVFHGHCPLFNGGTSSVQSVCECQYPSTWVEDRTDQAHRTVLDHPRCMLMSDVNRASLTDIHVHTHCNQKICLQTDTEVLMSLGFFYCFSLYILNTREFDLWRLKVWPVLS